MALLYLNRCHPLCSNDARYCTCSVQIELFPTAEQTKYHKGEEVKRKKTTAQWHLAEVFGCRLLIIERESFAITFRLEGLKVV